MTRLDPSPDPFKFYLRPVLHHHRTRGLLMGICSRGCVTSPTRHGVRSSRRVSGPERLGTRPLVRLGQNPQTPERLG
jgi:hypothetical protein